MRQNAGVCFANGSAVLRHSPLKGTLFEFAMSYVLPDVAGLLSSTGEPPKTFANPYIFYGRDLFILAQRVRGIFNWLRLQNAFSFRLLCRGKGLFPCYKLGNI